MLDKVVQQTQTSILPSIPSQGNWTYDHWLRFPDDGWKYEIIDGVLYMSPPPAIDHQRSSGKLFANMYHFVEEHDLGEVLEAPCGVRLPGQSVPVEPDIFFVSKENIEIIGKNYVEGAPDLIVEILSPSNPQQDRDIKFSLYQSSGVPEYWLVSYEAKTVELFNLNHHQYKRTGLYQNDDLVQSSQMAGFEIVVRDIFPK